MINSENMWKDEEERRNNFFKTLGEYKGYYGEKCIECGRYRVQVFSNGNLVCEKCGTDQKTKQTYRNEYGDYMEYLF